VVGYVFELKKTNKKENAEVKSEIADNQSFEYKGEEGKDALTILKSKTTVEQDKTGMVVSINGRKADNEKREFWSFYVNGVQSSVGSADYKTTNTDIINWKIEYY